MLLPLKYLKYLVSIDQWLSLSPRWHRWIGKSTGLDYAVHDAYRITKERWLGLFVNSRVYDEVDKTAQVNFVEHYFDLIEQEVVDLIWWLEDRPKRWIKESKKKRFIYYLMMKRLVRHWAQLSYRHTPAYKGYAAKRAMPSVES